MILYRFCSNRELQKLLDGKTIVNTTDHFKGGRGGSTSKGFCFTPDQPQTAWKYLKGIVTPEVCVKYEINRKLLHKSSGKYVKDTTPNPDGKLLINTVYKDKYCMTSINPKKVQILSIIPLESFVPVEELRIVRIAREFLNSITTNSNQ